MGGRKSQMNRRSVRSHSPVDASSSRKSAQVMDLPCGSTARGAMPGSEIHAWRRLGTSHALARSVPTIRNRSPSDENRH
nr:hypothetical protein [Candidatus Sigynarchaeum springense]